MLTKIGEWTTAVCLAVLLVSAAGCIPLVVGAAVGVGGYAWISGRLEQEFNVPAERLRRASVRGLRDLKVAIMEDVGDRVSARINAKFSDGANIDIAIDAKTEKVSTIKIRVGVLGDKERSELILNAIQKRL